jgi:serine/threonine protein phosphatase PrpC
VKRCTQCGLEVADEEILCRADGARLAPDRAELRSELPGAGSLACPQCGQGGADGGAGYCSECGFRLAPPSTKSVLPVGSTIGGRTVIEAHSAEDALVEEANGTVLVIVLGNAAALAAEGDMLSRLDDAPFPRLIEVGDDPERGAFLAVTPPAEGARRLSEAAPSLATDEIFELLHAVLDVAETVERHGYAWRPLPEDFHVGPRGSLDPGPSLGLLRARGARKISPDERLDARTVIEAVGAALLCEMGVRTSPRLVRLLMPHQGKGTAPPRSADAVRAALVGAERDRRALDNDGAPVCAICDPGLCRDHNEDATAVASGTVGAGQEPWVVLVVCDGVSSSMHADQASSIASRVACDALAHFARSGDMEHEAAAGAVAAAIRAAHVAICVQKIEHAGGLAPGTTIVAGLVYRRRLTVGWIGDSRAYWVSAGGAELLTRDHSWINEAVGRGVMTEEQALREPMAHAITKCLGPLEVGDTLDLVEPDVRVRELPGPGHIVLCTDGLWNYFPGAGDVAALVRAAGPGATPAAIARLLVGHALVRGGQDNVAVAVHAYKPRASAVGERGTFAEHDS